MERMTSDEEYKRMREEKAQKQINDTNKRIKRIERALGIDVPESVTGIQVMEARSTSQGFLRL